MNKLLLAATALIGFAAIDAASAADLALKAPPPPLVVDEWTGPYIGLNLGGSWGRSRTSYNDPDPAFVPFSTSQHMDGVLGGAQIGYNVQFNRTWLDGLEADFQGTGQRGSATIPPITEIFGVPGIATTTVTTTGTLTQKMPWFDTVRGRLGVEPGEHWLLYVTGGLAYAQIKSTAATSFIAMGPGGTATGRSPRASTTTAPDGRRAPARSGCLLSGGARKSNISTWTTAASMMASPASAPSPCWGSART
jgi:outer membrane immunogenic protein